MATDPRVEVIAELRKQTALLTLMQANLTAMAGALLDMADRQSGHATASSAPTVDLDGPHGDPIVKAKSPKDWAGESQQGKPFSQCPPAYLDLAADRLDYFLGKNADELKKAEKVNDEDAAAKFRKDIKYGTLDRDRARAWAARLRGGWTAPAQVHEAETELTW